MHAGSQSTRLEDFYRYLWPAEPAADPLEALLDVADAAGRGDLLMRAAADCGLARGMRVLDVGCGWAKCPCRLAAELDCEVDALDILEHNLAQAREYVEEKGLVGRVTLHLASMEKLPFEAAAFDFIWCTDMLSHVAALETALAECFRVLKPGGRMLLYCAQATDLLEPREARRVAEPMGAIPETLSRRRQEGAAQAAGFQIERREVTADAASPYYDPVHPDEAAGVLRLARLLRDRPRLVERFGESRVGLVEAHWLWNVYILIRKLDYCFYFLRKPV